MGKNRIVSEWGGIEWMRNDAASEEAAAVCRIVTILPGMQRPEHIHYSESQFVYILEGSGEQTVNGGTVPFSAGDHFFFPVGTVHSVRNTGETSLRELIAATPVQLRRDALLTQERQKDQEEALPDLKFVRSVFRQGVERISRETLDHLNVSLVITDAANQTLYSRKLTRECVGCADAGCPILNDTTEFRGEGGKVFRSLLCPKRLTILVQPVCFDGMICGYLKGGLFNENPIVYSSAQMRKSLSGATFDAIRILLQDMCAFLQDYYREKKMERELLLRDAEVEEEQMNAKALTDVFERTRNAALNIEIRNHFLFNTLNSIASLAVRDNSMDTYRAILDLSELLRGLLRQEGTRVPLSEELAFLRRYVSLQELRLESGLEVSWNCSEAADAVIVPHNFLQPIVENSFLHAFKDMNRVKKLEIRTDTKDNRAVITIGDNGCGMDAETLERLRGSLWDSTPHGLGMVVRKLFGVFGNDFSFELDSEPGKGTTYRLSLPI